MQIIFESLSQKASMDGRYMRLVQGDERVSNDQQEFEKQHNKKQSNPLNSGNM